MSRTGKEINARRQSEKRLSQKPIFTAESQRRRGLIINVFFSASLQLAVIIKTVFFDTTSLNMKKRKSQEDLLIDEDLLRNFLIP